MAFRRAYRRAGADKGINTLFVPVGNPGIVKDVSEEVFMTQPAFQSSYQHADPQGFSVINFSQAAGTIVLINPGAAAGQLEPAAPGFVWLIPELVISHSNPAATSVIPVLADSRFSVLLGSGQPLGATLSVGAGVFSFFRNLVIPSGHSLTLTLPGWTANAVNAQARCFQVEAGLDPWFGGVQCGLS